MVEAPGRNYEPNGPGTPGRAARHHGAEALSLGGLVTAGSASIVGTLFTARLGTDLAGTVAGAAVPPVVAALFTTRRAGGLLRLVAVLALSAAAFAVTVAGFTIPEAAIGRSLVADRPATLLPLTECENAEDDDADGFTDSDDPGCLDGRDLEESADWPLCENGADDDGDGLTDGDDVECELGLETEFPVAECENGADDDGDGLTDGDDFGCQSGDTEFDTPLPECDNGVDDDGDGLTDGDDFGCQSSDTEFD